MWLYFIMSYCTVKQRRSDRRGAAQAISHWLLSAKTYDVGGVEFVSEWMLYQKGILSRSTRHSSRQTSFLILCQLTWLQRRYDNITCVDYGISINSSKRYSGCGLHVNGHAHHQHVWCTLIDIPQSTHVMLSYLLWPGSVCNCTISMCGFW